MQKDITWDKFKLNNPDKTYSFENLCRILFKHEFCPAGTVLSSERNHPGVEVAPVLSNDGKWISFQSKFFDNRVKYEKIQESAEVTVKNYAGKLDVWYLYCNLPISNCPSFQKISKILNENGIEIIKVTNNEILTTVLQYPYIIDAFFGIKNLPMSWFKDQVNGAVGDLGIRYNEAFNVETKALNNMDLFVGNKRGIAAINGKKKTVLDSIIDHCNNLGFDDRANYDYIEKTYSLISGVPDVGTTDYLKAIEWYNTVEESLADDKVRIVEEINKIEENESGDDNRRYLRELYWERDIELPEYEIDMLSDKKVFIFVRGCR